jgi:hypothetical protein
MLNTSAIRGARRASVFVWMLAFLAVTSCASPAATPVDSTEVAPTASQEPTQLPVTTIVAPEPPATSVPVKGELSPYELAVEKIFTRTPQPRDDRPPWDAVDQLGCLPDLRSSVTEVKRSYVVGSPEPQALGVTFQADTAWGEAVFVVGAPRDSDGSEYSQAEFRRAVEEAVLFVNTGPGDQRKSDGKRDVAELVELKNGAAAQLNHLVRSEAWYGVVLSGPCTVSVQLPATTRHETVVELLQFLAAAK